jgi:signal transduction histidine kinase
MADLRQTLFKEDLEGKIRWLITLRWIAALGLAAAIALARLLPGPPLPLAPLVLGNLVLLVYNLALHRINRRLQAQADSAGWKGKVLRLANVQISVDLALLTYLLYFSGGMENPFAFYYIFHMILSSILLTNRSAYLQATLTALMVALVSGGVHLGWIPHHPASGWLAAGRAEPAWPAFLARFFALASTLFIAVYLTTTVVNQLRQRERELEEQDRQKSRYVMTVSHDIQASLAAAASCLKTVLEGLAGRVPPPARRMVGRAYRRSRLLLKFVRDLLEVSRLRAEADIEKRPVRLGELVRRSAAQFRRQAEEKGLRLVIDRPADDVEILACPTFLEQLLANLIGNAVRYSRPGGRITVSLRGSDPPGFARVCVADMGIGIPPEDLPHVFDDFYRAANARAFTANGTGLGLSIARRIVELHTGRIWVESRPGEGAAFSFILPMPAGGKSC